MAFFDDIQSRDTALYPVVIFETSSTAAGDIQISTKPVAIGNRTFDPLLISSPNIKESIDLQTRKYKISNVSLQVSNAEYNGERFSDRISLHEFGTALNTKVAMYWISPSVEGDSIVFQDDEANAAYFAYKGTIRDISHDEKSCKLTLEDISQSTLHRDVPIARLGTAPSVPEKYKNKPYPMVYGWVRASPLVFNNNYDDLIADSRDVEGFHSVLNYGFSLTKSPLYFHAGDRYVNVIEGGVTDPNTEFQSLPNQFTYSGNKFTLNQNNLEMFPTNNPDVQMAGLHCMEIGAPTSISIASTDAPETHTGDIVSEGDLSALVDGDLSANEINWNITLGPQSDFYSHNGDVNWFDIVCFQIKLNMSPNYEAENITILNAAVNGLVIGDHIPEQSHRNNFYQEYWEHYDVYQQLLTENGYSSSTPRLFNIDGLGNLFRFTDSQPGEPSTPAYNGMGVTTTVTTSTLTTFSIWSEMGMISLFNDYESFEIQVRHLLGVQLNSTTGGGTMIAISQSTGQLFNNFTELEIAKRLSVLKVFEKPYFGNIKGRKSVVDNSLMVNPVHIINDIIKEEVQSEIAASDKIGVDSESFTKAVDINSDFEMAFTVHDKKINSKKLIENISSNCRLIPYIKDNKVHYQGIHPNPSHTLISDGGDVELYLNSDDIISYNNNRTAAEKVYTKVSVNYNLSYSTNSLTRNTIDNNDLADTASGYFNVDDPHESGQTYEFVNLGLKAEQDLSFDSKYIRDSSTAQALQEFLLLWNCNQHNVLNLKVPLKYIQLKIGDYVAFDKLINGVKLFGEDYSLAGFADAPTHRNAQQILPVWMVTKTKKTLTHIDLELIQMHNCSPTAVLPEDLPPYFASYGKTALYFDGYYYINDPSFVTGTRIRIKNDGTERFQFILKLSATGVDPNGGDVQYKFDVDTGPLFNSIIYAICGDDLYQDIITARDRWGNEVALGEWIDSDNIELVLGVEAGDSYYMEEPEFEDPAGGWLGSWITDEDVEDGEHLLLEPGVFTVQCKETSGNYQLSGVESFGQFRIYKETFMPPEEEPPVYDEATVVYQAGWTVMGLPSVADYNINNSGIEFFISHGMEPGTVSMFDGTSYVAPTDITPAYNSHGGYWALFQNTSTIQFNLDYDLADDPADELKFLYEGHNLVSFMRDVRIQDLIDESGIIIGGSFYGFPDGTYESTATLRAGRAYWVRTSASGMIVRPAGSWAIVDG